MLTESIHNIVGIYMISNNIIEHGNVSESLQLFVHLNLLFFFLSFRFNIDITFKISQLIIYTVPNTYCLCVRVFVCVSVCMYWTNEMNGIFSINGQQCEMWCWLRYRMGKNMIKTILYKYFIKKSLQMLNVVISAIQYSCCQRNEMLLNLGQYFILIL